MLLQKKLQQVQQQNGCASPSSPQTPNGITLESAPTLVHHNTKLAPLLSPDKSKPHQFHSDVWQVPKLKNRKNGNLKIEGHYQENYARPMYRKDIFYSGSVYNVTEFQQSRQNMDTYLKSVTSIPDEVNLYLDF